MKWHRNDGQNDDYILQNRFTAYLLSAVNRRKAIYIDDIIRDQKTSLLIDEAAADRNSDLEYAAFKDKAELTVFQNEKLFLALTCLSDRERYVLFRRVLDEKGIDELAMALGLSYKGVAAIYYRAIQKIKIKMKGESK